MQLINTLLPGVLTALALFSYTEATLDEYILELKASTNANQYFADLTKNMTKLNQQLGSNDSYVASRLNIGDDFTGGRVRLTAEQFAVERLDKRLMSMHPNGYGSLASVSIVPCGDGRLCQENATWGLAALNTYGNKAIAGNGDNEFMYQTRRNGKQINVYVMDTGITQNTTEWGGRLRIGPNFSTDPSAEDMNGHGTNMASIIGSKSYGIAKMVHVTSVKVFNAWGISSHSAAISGFQWIWEELDAGQIYDVSRAIVSLSAVFEPNETFDAAISAYYKGKRYPSSGSLLQGRNYLIVATGNGGFDSCDYSPAKLGGVVVSVTAHNQDKVIPSWANSGACTEFVAPGHRIISFDHNYQQVIGYGTSQATAFAAGVFASLLSDKDLIRTGDDLPFNYYEYPDSFVYDNGILDAKIEGQTKVSPYYRIVLPPPTTYYVEPYAANPLAGSALSKVCSGKPYQTCKSIKFLNN